MRNGRKWVCDMKYYWFEFEDGYRCCVAGMSKQELRVEENKHGKLLTGDNSIKVYYRGKSKRIQTSPYENKEYSCFKATQEELLNEAIQDLPF